MDSRKKRGSHPHNKTAPGEDGFSPIALIRASLIGLAFAAGMALLLLLIGAFIAYSNKDPSALTMPISLAVLYLSLFCGGFASARTAKKNRLISGIFFSSLSLAVIFLLKLLITKGNGSGIENAMAYLVGSIAASLAGSLCTAFSAGSGKARRRKIRKK